MVQEAYSIAEERKSENIGKKLKSVYEKVLILVFGQEKTAIVPIVIDSG